MKVTQLLMIFGVGLVAFSSSFAVETSVFSGGEVDNRAQGFAYLGLDLSERLYQSLSLSVRVMPNFLTYKFRSEGRLTRATSPGFYTLAGVKFVSEPTTIGLFGGVEFRHTRLNPDIRSVKIRGDSVAGLIQGEFDHWLPSRTNLNGFASFSGTNSFLYERGRIKQQITNLDFKKSNTFNVGVEQIVGRNADFTQFGGGLVLEMFNIPNWVALSLRGGYKHDTTFGDGAYGGVEFYKRF
jgi:hypothetical protein